jgi:hypothetical protein
MAIIINISLMVPSIFPYKGKSARLPSPEKLTTVAAQPAPGRYSIIVLVSFRIARQF